MTTYSQEEFETLILGQINAIKNVKTPFDLVEASQALREAEMECGFSFPSISDSDASKKYRWIANRMRRWFYWRLYERYILQFNVGDLQAQGISVNMQKIVEMLDKEFEKGKEIDADIFTTSDVLFGERPFVYLSGLVEDRIGQSVEERETRE